MVTTLAPSDSFRLFPRTSQAALWLPSLDAVMAASNAGRNQRLDDARPCRAGAPRRRPPPGTLAMSIERRATMIELGLAGDLDMATAPRLRDAMAWLRISSDPTTTVVIDTSDVYFIAASGYRALQAALVGPNGLWDPRVILIVGPAVARLEAAITAASTRDR
jgi:anti-anti-sigma factor